MAESNKSTRSGLGGKPRPPITEEKPKEPEKEPKPRGSSPRPPKSIAPVIILVVAGFTVLGGIGWLLWSNEQKNSQQRIEIDQKYSKIKESIPQIDKDIASAKSLGDLKNLDVSLSKSGKDLDDLKNQAEQIGYSNGLDSIKADIETSKASSAKLNVRIASENNANAIIKEAKDSVNSFLKVENLSCDDLKVAEPKFGEAIAKLTNILPQTFVKAEAQKLSTEYNSLKVSAKSSYAAKCDRPLIPPSPPVPDPTPAVNDGSGEYSPRPNPPISSGQESSNKPKPTVEEELPFLPPEIKVIQGPVPRAPE